MNERRWRWLAVVAAAVLGGCLGSDDEPETVAAPALAELAPVGAPNIPMAFYGDPASSPPVATGWQRTERPRQDLGGAWHVRTDPDNVGLAAGWYSAGLTLGAEWRLLTVPGSLNHAFDDLFHYAGPAWYRVSFERDAALAAAATVRLRFDGVFREARVWLNGVELGRHDRPYLPFAFDVGTLLQAENNVLVVRIDSEIYGDTLPSVSLLEEERLGWWKYNGPIRPVALEGSAAVRVFRVHVTPALRADGRGGRFAAEIGVWNAGAAADGTLDVRWTDPDGEVRQTMLDARFPAGASFFALATTGAHAGLWTPAEPRLHELQVAATVGSDADTVAVRFGLRSVAVAQRQLLLNGRPYYMLGINRHEDHPESGPTEPRAVVDADLERIAALGANHVRTVHYPNRAETFDRLDELGFTAQEEIPLYQSPAEQLLDPSVRRLAAQSLTEMVLRDYNHPSIILWSVGNENGHFQSPEAGAMIGDLIARTKALDPSRPVLYVSNVIPTLTANVRWGVEHSDLVAYNHYFGWFYSEIAELDDFLDDVGALFPDKPILFTEWGAEAAGGRRHQGPVPDDEAAGEHSLSEDFQARYMAQVMDVYARRPEIVGQMPWVFADHYVHWSGQGLGLDYGPDYAVPYQQLFGLYTYEREPKLAVETVAAGYAELSAALGARGVETYR